MIKKLQNAYYVTRDMNRAVKFYRDVLGLKVKFQDGDNWAQFDAGGNNVSLASLAEAAAGATGATLILEVSDIAAARTALEQNGAAIVRNRDMGSHGKSLAFKDPDGNIVELFQRA